MVEIDSGGAVTATNTFGGTGLVSRRVGTTSTFYSFDSEGNVAQRSDGLGTLLSDNMFSAHGTSLGATLTEPFGYKAQFSYYTDTETGIQVLTHRYYDPSAGRFLTRDPIRYLGGINVYSYTMNNPVTYVDPYGLDVLVIEQGPTQGNPVGHTALAITGRGVFSFGNGRELATDSRGNIIGGNVADYIYRESGRRNTMLYIIKTTAAQDAAIEAALRNIAEREQIKESSILFDNCSTRSNEALDAGGDTSRTSQNWPNPGARHSWILRPASKANRRKRSTDS